MRFDSAARLIVVAAAVSGPARARIVRLAPDTGASRTLINPVILSGLGVALKTDQQTRITSATGVQAAPAAQVQQLIALGLSRADFPVVAHVLPAKLRLDGLLGLDFFRDRALRIDFRRGEIEVT